MFDWIATSVLKGLPRNDEQGEAGLPRRFK